MLKSGLKAYKPGGGLVVFRKNMKRQFSILLNEHIIHCFEISRCIDPLTYFANSPMTWSRYFPTSAHSR